MKQKAFILGIVLVALLGVFLVAIRPTSQKNIVPTPTVVQQIQTFSYKGENGKNALTILKEKTAVVQASSGLVTSINGRKADDKQHEYWAFYVNGKMAQVGPADYQTKHNDTILWKIETY